MLSMVLHVLILGDDDDRRSRQPEPIRCFAFPGLLPQSKRPWYPNARATLVVSESRSSRVGLDNTTFQGSRRVRTCHEAALGVLESPAPCEGVFGLYFQYRCLRRKSSRVLGVSHKLKSHVDSQALLCLLHVLTLIKTSNLIPQRA